VGAVASGDVAPAENEVFHSQGLEATERDVIVLGPERLPFPFSLPASCGVMNVDTKVYPVCHRVVKTAVLKNILGPEYIASLDAAAFPHSYGATGYPGPNLRKAGYLFSQEIVYLFYLPPEFIFRLN
jgi:hypothetical protein